jgi:4-amino-4-deoxy-L-arabinose transferase-like glycosyltransferase
VSESFAHRAPWWYYLPVLPLILFPWFVWPPLWKGVKEIKNELPVRFLAAWLVLTLIGFSLVSGKQAKYLVPFLPAFALLAGRSLDHVRKAPGNWEMLLPAAGFLALPAVLAWMRARPEAMRLPDWAAELPLWPLVMLACIAPFLFLYRESVIYQMRALAFAVLAGAAVLGFGFLPAFVPHGDPGPTAKVLAGLEAKKVPVAFFGKYHATYNFAGRLREPIDILGEQEVRAWVKAHPEGRVLTVERSRALETGPFPMPDYEARFRGAWLQLWRGEELLVARPELR